MCPLPTTAQAAPQASAVLYMYQLMASPGNLPFAAPTMDNFVNVSLPALVPGALVRLGCLRAFSRLGVLFAGAAHGRVGPIGRCLQDEERLW